MSSSSSSSPLSTTTACSSPTNDSIRHVVKNDVVRYRRQGYGLIIAIIATFCFFYFIPIILKSFWPRFETKNQFDMFYLIGGICVHTGVYGFGNIMMYLIYASKSPFFEKYKVLNKPWPWDENSQKWRATLKKTLKNLFFIHFVFVPITICSDILGGYKFQIDIDTFPSHLEIIKHIIFFMLIEDFLFYWSHRILHWGKIYPYVHKIHHEYTIAVSICAGYAHPIEWVFGNLLPTNLGFKILGQNSHFATYMIWMILRIMETIDGHSGYEFSWSPYRLLPLSGSSTYHNFHHSHNIGNYSSFFTFWDTLCGTNKAYFSYLAKRQKENLLGETGKDSDKSETKAKFNQHKKSALNQEEGK